jgi:hypothetical protein
MKAKHKQMQNPSFQWDVIDFNNRTKEYTIKNRVTGEKRTITKKQMLEIMTDHGENKNG